jgi:hypothetical protein
MTFKVMTFKVSTISLPHLFRSFSKCPRFYSLTFARPRQAAGILRPRFISRDVFAFSGSVPACRASSGGPACNVHRMAPGAGLQGTTVCLRTLPFKFKFKFKFNLKFQALRNSTFRSSSFFKFLQVSASCLSVSAFQRLHPRDPSSAFLQLQVRKNSSSSRDNLRFTGTLRPATVYDGEPKATLSLVMTTNVIS